jgi:hypothetical protein
VGATEADITAMAITPSQSTQSTARFNHDRARATPTRETVRKIKASAPIDLV